MYIDKYIFRLINTNKTNVEKVAKDILENIIKKVIQKCKLQQWQSMGDVLKWFKNYYKSNMKMYFVQFNIVTFYPAITKDLMIKALNWAKTVMLINKEEVKYILQACEHLLYSKGEP